MGEVGQLGKPRDADLRDYAFRKDGSVVIDGDVVYDCRSFAGEFAAGGAPTAADADPDLEQARSVLEQCEEAGFLSSGSATSSASASASATSDASAGGAEGDLPDSGGPALSMLLGASSVLLVASSLLVRKVAR